MRSVDQIKDFTSPLHHNKENPLFLFLFLISHADHDENVLMDSHHGSVHCRKKIFLVDKKSSELFEPTVYFAHIIFFGRGWGFHEHEKGLLGNSPFVQIAVWNGSFPIGCLVFFHSPVVEM